MKKQQGFTLIELMIVVAIIGVLSAIAIPAYKDYVTKSEVASAVSTMKALITPLEAHIQENGSTTMAKFDDIGTIATANPLGVIEEPKLAGKIINFVFKFGDKSSIKTQTVTFTKDTAAKASIWTCAHNVTDVEIKGCTGPTTPTAA